MAHSKFTEFRVVRLVAVLILYMYYTIIIDYFKKTILNARSLKG